MIVQSNKYLAFGAIIPRLPQILMSVLTSHQHHQKHNIVFVCRNVRHMRECQTIMVELLIEHNVHVTSARSPGIIHTDWYGSFRFCLISNVCCAFRGLSITMAYIDISQSQIYQYSDDITNIHIRTLHTNREWDEYDQQTKDNQSGTIDHSWSGSARWIRKGWENTMEMFR